MTFDDNLAAEVEGKRRGVEHGDMINTDDVVNISALDDSSAGGWLHFGKDTVTSAFLLSFLTTKPPLAVLQVSML